MAVFDYQALDRQGREKKGVVEADSERAARHKLRAQGLSPIKIIPVRKGPGAKVLPANQPKVWSLNFGQANKLKVVQLAAITRQLATLLNSGLPLADALQAVAEQEEDPKIARIVQAVRGKVLEGHPLAVGMAEFPQAFPELYRTTVNAGEKSGHLDLVLTSLAEYTEKQHFIHQKIQQAAVYPILMIFVSIAIVSFLMIFVVPKMVGVFQGSGQKLPILTVFLINLSNFLQHYGLYTLILLVAAGFMFKRALRNLNFKYKVDQFMLKIPVIGRALRTINTARFARTFGILFKAGVPVLEAMDISKDVVSLLPIREALVEAITKVREGCSISLALRQTGYFPAMSVHLVASGEASGQLEQMLTHAADNQDRDVNNLIDSSLSLFEPIMILVMGSVVLVIVLAILVPVLQMNQFAAGG